MKIIGISERNNLVKIQLQIMSMDQYSEKSMD